MIINIMFYAAGCCRLSRSTYTIILPVRCAFHRAEMCPPIWVEPHLSLLNVTGSHISNSLEEKNIMIVL